MKLFRSLLFSSLLLTGINLMAQPGSNAMRQMQMGQFGKAKAAFLRELNANNSADLWYNLGLLYVNSGKADSATICFAKATLADPKSSLGVIGQTMVDLKAGRVPQSGITLDKLQKSAASAKDVKALTAIANARYISGDTARWMEPLSAIATFDRKNINAYNLAGDIYTALAIRYPSGGYFGKASGRFEQALYYEPGNVEAITKLAGIYFIMQSYMDAWTKLKTALELDSVYLPALKQIGQVEYSLGKYELASNHFGRYMALTETSYPDYSKDRVKYINILYFNREYAKANDLIEKALKNDPSNQVLLRLKGYTAYELNKYADGLAAMGKFFQLRSAADTSKIIPTDYEYYGKLLSKSGEDSLATLILAKAIEMDTARYSLYEDIAKSYEKMKKYKLAVETYDKLIKTGRNASSATYFSKGRDLYFIANEIGKTADSLQRPEYIKQADSCFGMVCVITPASHLGYLWHARMSAALDPESSVGLAKPYYEKAISIMESKNDLEKYKKDLLEGYRYMGYFFYLKFDAAKTAKDDTNMALFKTESANYWQKILAIDPNDKGANDGMKAL